MLIEQLFIKSANKIITERTNFASMGLGALYKPKLLNTNVFLNFSDEDQDWLFYEQLD